MKRIVLIILVGFVTMAGLFSLRFSSALAQEGNPLPILISIMKLNLSNKDYVQFSETPQSLRSISATTKENSQYNVVIEFMGKKGWRFSEQIGSGLVFEKDQEHIVVSTRQFTRNYFLWNIPTEVFN